MVRETITYCADCGAPSVGLRCRDCRSAFLEQNGVVPARPAPTVDLEPGPERDGPARPGDLQCPACPRVFTDGRDLERHVERIHGTLPGVDDDPAAGLPGRSETVAVIEESYHFDPDGPVILPLPRELATRPGEWVRLGRLELRARPTDDGLGIDVYARLAP